jgi:hypothetical protein
MPPVYVVGFTSGLSLHVGDPQQVVHGVHGWYRKVAWLVGPDYGRPVTLRGSRAGTAAPLWFEIGGQSPSTRPVLNPLQPAADLPNGPPGWAAFPSYLFIPQAGCYVLGASWPGGRWQITFAAGQ